MCRKTTTTTEEKSREKLRKKKKGEKLTHNVNLVFTPREAERKEESKTADRPVLLRRKRNWFKIKKGSWG